MGTITEKTRSLSVTADYENDEKGLAISLNYRKDATTDALVSLDGQVNDTNGSAYIGSFSGNSRNGRMQYSFSGIEDLTRIADIVVCVQDIESQINVEE